MEGADTDCLWAEGAACDEYSAQGFEGKSKIM